jgi:molybdopterin-guanine dinucleotide biosynthesis protein A
MCNAAILTGGRARRFHGADKSALVVDGRPILDRQIAALTAVAGLQEILLVGGAQTDPRARMIPDRIPNAGPLGGIHAALSTLPPAPADATMFILACDMPYVSTLLISHLLSLAHTADMVVPRTDRGYHPLCAVYTRACLEPIARLLAGGRLKVMNILGEVRVRVVAAEELDRFGECHRLLSNVNTPVEHAALQDSQGSQGHQL